ncbi:hypothetical protein ACH5RR_034022 [Cinchona calisaya]|uniref:F-box domain-containing protein n=1 Tax=Cinchona calisaya TaxID=153742 RepID=A0ABD2YAY0_9GENT
MEQISGNENLLFNLPSHISIDILSRLSTKTVCLCRCVCKDWQQLLSGPEFAGFRLLRSPTTSLMIHKNMASFNLVELEDEPNNHDFYYVPGTRMEPSKDNLPPYRMFMFGSVNGLISLHDYGYQNPDNVCIWNPATRESINIQSAGGVMEYPNVTTYGFGLSLKSGHYKVVRIYQEMDRDIESGRISKSDCHVYTLGNGCWRYTGRAPFLYSCRTHGVFLNGNLHWLINDPDGHETISCFDLEKESFQPFPAPPELHQHNLASLELYQDCLCVCDNTSDFDLVIWVMKEYGIKKSWGKEFVIDKHPIDLVGQWYEVFRILKVFRDGEILLLWRDDNLYSFNSKSNALQGIDIHKFLAKQNGNGDFEEWYPSIVAVDYVSSFISLNNFAGEKVENTL